MVLKNDSAASWSYVQMQKAQGLRVSLRAVPDMLLYVIVMQL